MKPYLYPIILVVCANTGDIGGAALDATFGYAVTAISDFGSVSEIAFAVSDGEIWSTITYGVIVEINQ